MFLTIIHHTSALTTQEVLEIAVFICEPFEAHDLVSILFMHRLSLPCRSGQIIDMIQGFQIACLNFGMISCVTALFVEAFKNRLESVLYNFEFNEYNMYVLFPEN